MHSTEFILGFATGIVLIAVGALIVAKKFKQQSKFDERQQLLRSRAYQAAFWVLAAYMCINGIFNMMTGIAWADMMTSSFIGICVAITVFVVICIRRDAYFPINQKPKLYFVLFGGLIVMNLALGMLNVFDDDTSFLTDGMLNYHVISFVVAALLAGVLIALAVKRLKAKTQSETD